MSLASSIIGSSQTSKAVGSLVNSTNQAIQVGGDATKDAQTAVLGAGNTANNTLASTLQTQQDQLSPYLNLGSTAANNLSSALAPGGSLTNQFSFDPTQISKNPDYQFQLNEGIDAVKRAAAATGTLGSSQTLKGVANYAGGLASTEIGQDYQRALSTFNTNRANTLQNFALPLSVGAGAVQQSGQELGQYGTQVGNNLINTNSLAATYGIKNADNSAQLILDRGNAQANGSLQQGKIWSGYANSVGAGLAAGLG